MTFNPKQGRASLVEVSIPSARSDEFSEAAKIQALYSYGSSIRRCCIKCLVVGLFDVGRELLPKARTFLKAAIDRKEDWDDRPAGGGQFLRYCELAQCHWLLESRHDLDNLKEAVRWKEIWFNEGGDTFKPEVQLSLSDYLNAEEYEILIQRFEHANLRKPSKLRQIAGEGTMAYVIARHRFGLEYSTDEVEAAVEAFLKRNVPAWLEGGQYTTAALWMKLAFWKPGDDPIATLLKCYDYLPGVDPPAYP